VLVLAHAGHWAVSLIYLVPFAVIGVWLVRDRLRHGGEAAPREPGEER
jgi:hypothetical protein